MSANKHRTISARKKINVIERNMVGLRDTLEALRPVIDPESAELVETALDDAALALVVLHSQMLAAALASSDDVVIESGGEGK